MNSDLFIIQRKTTISILLFPTPLSCTKQNKMVIAGTSRVSHRILMGFDGGDAKFGGGAVSKSLADIDFGCFDEDVESSPGSSCNEIEDEDEEVTPESIAERKAFWEDQYQLLHATLSRTTALETRIREVTKEVMNESQLICFCSKPVTGGGCRNCSMIKIRDRLQNAGYDSAICKSKWKRSQEIPAGEHTYIDVVEKSSSKKGGGGDIRVVIELGFRAEFEMGRASEEYKRLINRLPEVFVGKAERMKTVVKMMCAAAKTCMKETKMHMGPWRKHKYVQAKWFGPFERKVSDPVLPVRLLDRTPFKPRCSLLTFDLVEKLPSFQHLAPVVEVLRV